MVWAKRASLSCRAFQDGRPNLRCGHNALCSQCKRGAYCLHLAPNPPAHIGIDREEPRLDENLSGLRRRRNIKRPGVKARRPLRVFCEKRTAVYSVSHGMPSREPRQWARFERAALLFQGRSQARSRPMENGFDGVRETIVSVGRVQFRHGQNMLVDVVGQPPLTELVVAPDFKRHLDIPDRSPQSSRILLFQRIQIGRTRPGEFDHPASISRWMAQDHGRSFGHVTCGDW
jgi:hypothetical protein